MEEEEVREAGGLEGAHTGEAEPGHQLVWPSGPLHPVAQQETTPHCEVTVETLYYAKQVNKVRAGYFLICLEDTK